MDVIRFAAITGIFFATACLVLAIGLAIAPHVFLGSVPSHEIRKAMGDTERGAQIRAINTRGLAV